MIPSERKKDPNANFRILEGKSVAGAGRAYVIITCGVFFRQGDDEAEMLFGEAFVAVPTSSRSWKIEPVRLTFPRGQLDVESAVKLLEDCLRRTVQADLDEHLVGWRNGQAQGPPLPPPYAFEELDPERVKLWLRDVLGDQGLENVRRWTLSAPLATYLSRTKKLAKILRESFS